MKGALIGFGEVAEKAHAPAFRKHPGVSIAAIADNGAARRRAAKAAFPEARVYASAAELLREESGLDFADIAAPPHSHAPLIKAALGAGLPVLCEKPLTLGAAEFDEVAAAASSAGRAVFPVHNWKYAPLFQKLKVLLDEDAVGPVSHIEWHTLRTRPAVTARGGRKKGNWRTDAKLSGGGILMDHGWHAFYLVSWLAGKAPAGVSGVLKGPAGAAESEATCLVEFPGTTGVIHLSWESPVRGHWGIVRGPRGAVEIADDRLIVRTGSSRPAEFVFAEALSKGSAHPDWFFAMLADFEAALGDPRLAAAALDEAGRCARAMDAVYSASR